MLKESGRQKKLTKELLFIVLVDVFVCVRVCLCHRTLCGERPEAGDGQVNFSEDKHSLLISSCEESKKRKSRH